MTNTKSIVPAAAGLTSSRMTVLAARASLGIAGGVTATAAARPTPSGARLAALWAAIRRLEAEIDQTCRACDDATTRAAARYPARPAKLGARRQGYGGKVIDMQPVDASAILEQHRLNVDLWPNKAAEWDRWRDDLLSALQAHEEACRLINAAEGVPALEADCRRLAAEQERLWSELCQTRADDLAGLAVLGAAVRSDQGRDGAALANLLESIAAVAGSIAGVAPPVAPGKRVA